MLSVKTILGASWSISGRLLARMIDLVSLLVLARVLTPADFGLMAIAASFVSIAEMVLEVPLVQALLRLPRIEKTHLDTAFAIGLLRGAVLAILMAAAAWPIAYFYQDNRLSTIILVLTLVPVARGLYSPAMIYYYLKIEFHASFLADIVGKLIATIISLFALYLGVGYWALIINNVLSAVLPTALSYVFAPYRPRLSLEKLGDFSSFTGWFTSSQIVGAVSWQYERVFLGYHADKTVVGRYGVASDLAVMPTQAIIGPAMRPVMAAFATIKDDPRRLSAAFLKTTRLTMLIAIPVGTGIALTSDQIVHIFLGEQWGPAAVYLQWLSLAIMLTAYTQPVVSLCIAKDRPDIIFQISIIELAIKICLMTTAYYLGGVLFMVYARLIAAVVVLFIVAAYSKKLASIDLLAQMNNLWQVCASCLVMTVSVLIIKDILLKDGVGLIGLLAAMSLCGAAVFASCMHVLGFRFQDLRA